MTPEQKARVSIDALLVQAGWHVCDMAHANIHAARGVALREFPLNTGYGFADYLLYIDGKAAGVIEAKKEGSTLTGVEVQSARYAQGLPAALPAWVRPLPFSYESTGIETHFTQGLDPQPRARAVFAFHRPETLAAFLNYMPAAGAATPTGAIHTGTTVPPGTDFIGPTFLSRMQTLPPLIEQGLWPAQIIAIRNLEASLKANKPRALIQMATGSGKTFTAISFIYRLIKFAGAKRVLFLVDRGNLGRQAKKEFDQYNSPYNNYKFGEEYIVQHLTSNQLDSTARVTICTIQRLFSMLKGRELAEEDEEQSVDRLGNLFTKPEPIGYNPNFPIETFDIIVTDEAHRSIYNLWRQVLEYFDAYDKGVLNLSPTFQRKSVWRDRDRHLLIESLLRGFPIPAIFLYQRNEAGRLCYDVIDGKQRLETILRFMGSMRRAFTVKASLPGLEGVQQISSATLKRNKSHMTSSVPTFFRGERAVEARNSHLNLLRVV